LTQQRGSRVKKALTSIHGVLTFLAGVYFDVPNRAQHIRSH